MKFSADFSKDQIAETAAKEAETSENIVQAKETVDEITLRLETARASEKKSKLDENLVNLKGGAKAARKGHPGYGAWLKSNEIRFSLKN